MRVPLDHRNLQDIDPRDRDRVIDQDPGPDRELTDGAPHGFIGRLENIDLIDPVGGYHDDCPGQGLFADLVIEDLPALLRDLFGVIEIRQDQVFREDDRRSGDRTRQGPPAGFVDPADRTMSARPAHRLLLKQPQLLYALEFRPHAGLLLLLRDLCLCHFFLLPVFLSDDALPRPVRF